MAPATGSFTFNLTSVSNTKFYIEGTLLITNNCCSSTTGAISLIKNQYYKGYITYSYTSTPISLSLSWAYTGQANIYIPATSLYYPAYVGYSPYQITVTCPAFYKADSSSGTPSWVINCGDGLRYGTESCDDGNSVSGDGCSSTWKNENYWICNGGSNTSKDVWSKCAIGYINNSDYTHCDLKVISDYVKWLAVATWAMICVGLVVETLNAILTKTAPMGVYFTLEHVQLIVLFPTLSILFTDDLYGFFRLIKHALLSYDFINIEATIFRSYSYSQDNAMLYLLGFESSSTAVNSISYLLGFGIIAIFQLMCFRLYGALEDKGIQNTRFYDYLKVIYPWFFLNSYIRYLFSGSNTNFFLLELMN